MSFSKTASEQKKSFSHQSWKAEVLPATPVLTSRETRKSPGRSHSESDNGMIHRLITKTNMESSTRVVRAAGGFDQIELIIYEQICSAKKKKKKTHWLRFSLKTIKNELEVCFLESWTNKDVKIQPWWNFIRLTTAVRCVCASLFLN